MKIKITKLLNENGNRGMRVYEGKTKYKTHTIIHCPKLEIGEWIEAKLITSLTPGTIKINEFLFASKVEHDNE